MSVRQVRLLKMGVSVMAVVRYRLLFIEQGHYYAFVMALSPLPSKVLCYFLGAVSFDDPHHLTVLHRGVSSPLYLKALISSVNPTPPRSIDVANPLLPSS